MSNRKRRYFIEWESKSPISKIGFGESGTLRLEKPIKKKKDIDYICNLIKQKYKLSEDTEIKINRLLIFRSSGAKEVNIQKLK